MQFPVLSFNSDTGYTEIYIQTWTSVLIIQVIVAKNSLGQEERLATSSNQR